MPAVLMHLIQLQILLEFLFGMMVFMHAMFLCITEHVGVMPGQIGVIV